jgi:chromosome segregation ATPase
MELSDNALNAVKLIVKDIVTTAIDEQSMMISEAFDVHDREFENIDKRFDGVDMRLDRLELHSMQQDSELKEIRLHQTHHDNEFKEVRKQLETINNDVKALYELVAELQTAEEENREDKDEIRKHFTAEIKRVDKNLKLLAKAAGVKLAA